MYEALEGAQITPLKLSVLELIFNYRALPTELRKLLSIILYFLDICTSHIYKLHSNITQLDVPTQLVRYLFDGSFYFFSPSIFMSIG